MLLAEPLEQRIAVGERTHAIAHRREVVDHHLHLGDRIADFVGDKLHAVGRTSVELDQRPRLEIAGRERVVESGDAVLLIAYDRQHRMDEQVDAEPVTIEHHPHGVDEERDVVGDEHEHRTLAPPAIALDLRREHLDEDLPGEPRATQREVGDRRGVRGIEATGIGVVGGELAVVALDELREHVVVRATLPCDVDERAHRLRHVGVGPHAASLAATLPPRLDSTRHDRQ